MSSRSPSRCLPAAWVTAAEGPDTWSPWDIPGHLIHGERTANLATLIEWHLTPAHLARTGEHPDFGTVTLGHALARVPPDHDPVTVQRHPVLELPWLTSRSRTAPSSSPRGA